MYILCKCFGGEDLTEHQKTIQPGELWVRLADTPIALPIEDVIGEETYLPLSNLAICDI